MIEQQYLLKMVDISKSFSGVPALRKISLNVRPGTVHALVGENGAGKSTLVKCLFGIYEPDEGGIFIDGRQVHIRNSKTALELGISMIHQELHSIPYCSVMENMWLGRFPVRKIGFINFVDGKRLFDNTTELLNELEMNINPNTIIKKLSVSQIQSIEIAKAISFNARIIIMDEPTSSLTSHEVDRLFNIINGLKARNVSIIYISHKMEEILRISDEVTVMRDGNLIGTWDSNSLTKDFIISKIVGRSVIDRYPRRSFTSDEVVLRVSNISSSAPKGFKNISFELKKGEIFGIGGLVGAQRTELVEALFGARPIQSGEIFLRDKKVRIKSPIIAKKLGFAFLTEDRHQTGIVPTMNILFNIVISSLSKYKKRNGLLSKMKMRDTSMELINTLKIKMASIDNLVVTLSGGNQQKAILARWLLTNPEILILDEPTRGIDIGAKFDIYSIINELAEQGKSIIMITSEMPELIGMSDRVAVMCAGKISGILEKPEITEKNIMNLATKYLDIPQSP